MDQVDALSADGCWVILKLEKMKAQTLEPDEEEGADRYRSTTSAGWRLTVRGDDRIDASRLVSLFRSAIEKATGASPAAMQPFYVYGVIVFEWRERMGFDERSLLGMLRELVLKTDLKRNVVVGQ
jgi:hypothetical protein